MSRVVAISHGGIFAEGHGFRRGDVSVMIALHTIARRVVEEGLKARASPMSSHASAKA